MKYDLIRTCSECPFRKEGGARVANAARANEIARASTFTCHKTVGKGEPAARACAGHLIYHEKHGTPTQMMRIAERLGLYDAGGLDRL